MYIRRPVVDYKFVRVISTEDLVPPCQTRSRVEEEEGARRVRGEILRDTRPDSLPMKYSSIYTHTHIYSIPNSIPMYARTCTGSHASTIRRKTITPRE